VHDVNDAHERGRAVRDRRRTAQDLDALDVLKIQGGQSRIERAAPGYAVDDEKERIELAEAPEFRDSARRTRVATGRNRNSGGECERVAQRCGAAGAEVFLTDHFDRRRYVVRRFGEAGGDDFYRRNSPGRLRLRLSASGNGAENEQRGREDDRTTRHGLAGGGRRRARQWLMNSS